MENQDNAKIFTPRPAYYEGQAFGEFLAYFRPLTEQKRKDWCLAVLEKYWRENPSTYRIQFVLAQAYDQFGEPVRAKALYQKLLPLMKDTYGDFIQDKLNNL